MSVYSKISRIIAKSLVIVGIAILATHPGFAPREIRNDRGSSLRDGVRRWAKTFGVTLNIYEFSTPADRVTLVQAYEKGQNQGLVNALQKMKAVGHVEITGTLGFDCAYIKMTPTPTGRKDRLRHKSADPLWGSLLRHSVAVVQPHRRCPRTQ